MEQTPVAWRRQIQNGKMQQDLLIGNRIEICDHDDDFASFRMYQSSGNESVECYPDKSSDVKQK